MIINKEMRVDYQKKWSPMAAIIRPMIKIMNTTVINRKSRLILGPDPDDWAVLASGTEPSVLR